jgi:hypothetical protein
MVQGYKKDALATVMKNANPRVSYLPYDWSSNSK